MARLRTLVVALALALPLSAGPLGGARADDETAATLLAKGQEAEKGSAEEACPVYLRLLEKFPKDDLAPRARLRLGLCLKKLGRVEEARARLREARLTGKKDEPFCHEVDLALMDLPPEPDKPKTTEPPAPPPTPPGPPATDPRTPPSKPPAPPAEPDERTKLQNEIADAEKENKALIKKAQELEDAGRTEESYALRAKADKRITEIDAMKAKLRGMPAGKPRPPYPPKDGKEPPADHVQQRRMMERRRDELEKTAKAADVRVTELVAQGKYDLAAIAQSEAAKARAEAAALQKRIEALSPPPPPPKDPSARKEASLREGLEKARTAEKDAQTKGDEAASKKAHDEVAARERELHDFLVEREAANEKARLERFADTLKKRGLPGYEIDERLAYAKTEYELQRAHEERVAALSKELKERNAPEAEQRSKLEALTKAHKADLDKLKAEVEARILAIAKVELEVELQKRAAEQRAQGVSAHEIDVKLVADRRDLEARLPNHRDEAKKPSADAAGSAQKDNQRLRERVDELEKELAAALREIAALRQKLRERETAAAATPTQATTNPPGR
ncbi:hypothetical protein HY251_20425 [bacterium]|nr:hypothetical protein [bacterium]